MINPIENVRIIDLGDETIVLDPVRLKFNDMILGEFLEELTIWYDYYSSKSAKIEEMLANCELLKDSQYDSAFIKAKSEGFTDKSAEALARTEILELQKKENFLKSAHKQMKEYLKSLDKAHSLATNRSCTLRKEMEKLGHTPSGYSHSREINVDDIIGKINPLELQ